MENQFSRKHPTFGAPVAAKDVPATETAQQSPMQEVAAPVQPHAGAKEYTVPVDEIRSRLHVAGIEKSKDTVQRYCREGQLDCQKQGILKRYFATEKSVLDLMEKLEVNAPASDSMQVHEAAYSSKEEIVQPHAGAEVNSIAENKDPHAGASNSMQVHEGAHEKIEAMYETQLKDKDKEIAFLREELIDRRTAQKALETLVEAFKTNSEATLLNAQNTKNRMDGEPITSKPVYTHETKETDVREGDSQ